jgi:hypothetical protein
LVFQSGTLWWFGATHTWRLRPWRRFDRANW